MTEQPTNALPGGSLIQRKYYIMGSSGFAREIKAYIRELHVPQDNIVFVDDNSSDAIGINKYHEEVNLDRSAVTILGSGKPEIKIKMLKQVVGHFYKLIHPRSIVSPLATVGIGSVIAPGAVVSPHSIVSEHVLINYNSTVGHDAIIGSLAVVSPNASIGGWVRIGEGTYIGSGAQIREKLDIGHNVVVGMGAVVTKDVPDTHVAIGNPAKLYTKEEWNRRVANGKGKDPGN